MDDILTQQDTIMRNYEWRNRNVVTMRVQKLIALCAVAKHRGGKILDVGCGGYMPRTLHADAAVDINELSGTLLRRDGWVGDFRVVDGRNLPFRNKEFDLAVCSEVIEHMDSVVEVRQLLAELRRVAHEFIVTTPAASAPGVRDPWNTEPTHKLFFTEETLLALSDAGVKKYELIKEPGQIKHILLTGSQ